MNESQTLGSDTAKAGFRNEDAIVDKFNDWKNDSDAQKWLEIMNYDLKEIEKVEAIKLHGYKTDVQVQITIYLKEAISAENLSIKLVSNKKGFNQIDKRWVSAYVKLWNIPNDLETILKLFVGEILSDRTDLRDSRRMFFDEMDAESQNKIVQFFTDNKVLIVSDILKGRGKFSAEWMLVAQKADSDARWVLKNMNEVINHFSSGDVIIKPRGSLQIGRIGMQRKGGDGGRKTAQMLQFKIDPTEVFNI